MAVLSIRNMLAFFAESCGNACLMKIESYKTV
jgi:hypothetical protein